MSGYIYQDWFRGKRKMQSEEDTLWYYANLYKPRYDPNLGDVEMQKQARKFLKTCESSEAWARFAYENDLQFQVCKMDGQLVEANLEQDNIKDITVSFLDEYNRIFMYYAFNREANGDYFLFAMVFWEFIEGKKGDDDYTTFWKYLFEPNGDVKVIERNKVTNEETIWTSKRPLNVESNWEKRPEFGDWEGFFTMKRWAEGELDEPFKGNPIKEYIYKDGSRFYRDEDGNLIEDN